jgi:hypothetical protein
MAHDNSNTELADLIIENNLHQNTKKQYLNKVKHVYEWFKINHVEFCIPPLNNELKLAEIAELHNWLRNLTLVSAKTYTGMVLP